MNCREFDLQVIDWARNADSDVHARREAEAHAAACSRCRERLAAERALTASLEQLANSAAARETPAGVEDLLRVAFREQIAATPPSPARSHPSKSHLNESHLNGGGDLKDRWHLPAQARLGRAAWMGAAAAAVIAGVLLWTSLERGALPPEMRPEVADTAPLGGEPGTERVSNEQASNGQPSGEQASEEQPRVITSQAEMSARAEPPSRPPAVLREEPEEVATAQSRQATTLSDTAGANAPGTVREVTTGFLPFPYTESLSVGERMQLIHVRLPGEALTYFGQPPAADRSATVPADVLLGQDGTARAVRFVRFTGSGNRTSGID
jgi:hypothetical protein